MEDLVSIIIPIYNVERFLRDCLDSVIKQTYSNLEIILVDDGSTDGCLEICREYQKKDNRVHVFHQENKGCSIARNLGLKHAHGIYISFFDSDDVMHPDRMEEMVAIMKKEDADLVIGNYDIVTQDGTFLENKKEVALYEVDSPTFKYCSFAPFPGNKLYRLSILKEKQIEWKQISIAEDLVFYLSYILWCKKVSFTSDSLFNYRIVENSLSRKYDLKILSIKDAFLEIEKFYAENNNMEKFRQYIEPLKIVHYYYQFSKIKFFKRKERRDINAFFKKEMKLLKKYKNKSPFIRNIYFKYQLKSMYYTLF